MNIATRSRQSRRLGTTTPLVSLAWLLGLVLLVAHDPWQSDHSVGGSHSCFAVVAAFQLSPSTQPGDVIERQLAALRDGDLEKVYEFASPGNKAQTGDVANFSRMVRSGPYRYLLGHSRSDVLLESKMASSRQFLVRVTATVPDKPSSPDFDDFDDDDENYQSYAGSAGGESNGSSSNNNKPREKILEYWWSLSRCKTGEYTGSYMVDAVIPNQIM